MTTLPTLQITPEQAIFADEGKLDIQHEEVAVHCGVRRGDLYSEFEAGGIIETIKLFKICFCFAFAAAFSAMTDGYQVGINGSIVANAGFVDRMGKINSEGVKALPAVTLTTWGNVFAVGQIIGLTGMSFVADRFGRKVSMYSYWFILAISVLLESVSTSPTIWYPAKLLAGVGVGAMQMTLPTYIAEIAPVRIRGMLLMLYNFWFSVGGFLAPVVLKVLQEKDARDWKTPIYTQWAHVGAMLIIYVFLPESPHWCANVGKHDYGKKMLRRINGSVPGFDINNEYNKIVLTIEEENRLAVEAKNTKFWAIFKGVNGFRTIVSAFTLMAQTFVGTGLIYNYTAYFFEIAGSSDPFMSTIITNIVNLCTVLLSITFTDRIGRRPIVCIGIGICWLSVLSIGVLGVAPQSGATQKLLVVFACTWFVGLQSSGSAGFAYMGETASARLRAKTCGFSLASSAAIGIGIGSAVPYMLNKDEANWGIKAAWFYVCTGLPFAIGAWFLMPEVSRRSPAELDELFENKVRPWNFKKTVTSIEKEGRQSHGMDGTGNFCAHQVSNEQNA